MCDYTPNAGPMGQFRVVRYCGTRFLYEFRDVSDERRWIARGMM